MYGSANLNLGGHFRRNARIEPHADRKIACVADVGHINAALFHLHAILLKQLVGNLLRGDGAVKPAALRAARHDLDGLAGKRLAGFLRLGALNVLAVLLRGLRVLDGVQIRRARLARQPLGKEEVAGKSVGSLDDLILLAGSLDILS